MKTSLYSILCIVIRLGAVILGVRLLMELPALLLASHEQTGHWTGAALSLVFLGFLALMLFLLWLFPSGLARLGAGKSAGQIFESPIGTDDFIHIGFAIVGAVFLLQGVAITAYEALRLLFNKDISGGIAATAPLRVENWLPLVKGLISVGLGAAMILGSRGLVRFLRRTREAGLSSTRQQED
ncbi:MAG: hypothetical protein ABIY40_07595 [Rhodanobacteraceae bacterium]